MARIEGIVEDVVYRNEENGYTVLNVMVEEEEITLVGAMFGVMVGERIMAEGEFSSHSIYGDQLKVSHIETTIPNEVEAIKRYLGSGAIKGIGPALAKRVVKQFGVDTFFIIENQPEELVKVKGISRKKAQDIAQTFSEQRVMRQAIIFLQEYGLSLTYAIKIYSQYKERTYAVIKKNPYLLAEEIKGISFRMADEIANKLGIEQTSEFRLMAAIKHVLHQSTKEGHTFLEMEVLEKRTIELLQLEEVPYTQLFMELQLKGQIVIEDLAEKTCIFLTAFDQMEKHIASKLYELSYLINEEIASVDQEVSIKKDIQQVEEEMGMTLDEKQRKAIQEAITCGVLIVTGGPGTGKTTTLNAMIQLFEDRDQEVLLGAPTGRAAKRMSEATGKEAKTIHRLLEISGSAEGEQRFERNETYPLEGDVIVIDEISMMDTILMYHLLKAISVGTKVILVGDKDQLPSVGPGNILKDMMGSNYVPTIRLERIFRQAGESHIVVNAHKINAGEAIDLKDNKKDFFFLKRRHGQKIIEEMITLIQTRLPKFANLESWEGIQVLTPTRKGLLGVNNLNMALQKALNPKHDDKIEKEYRGRLFREGDKVMQIKNNYTLSWRKVSEYGFTAEEGLGVFNGDIGKIEEINLYTEKIKVIFDDERQVYYEFKGLEELDLAYAVTIHKSQGSEYPVVIIPMFKGPTLLLNRNLLYTGITRAKQYVVLIGDDQVVKQMIGNKKEMERNSALKERIIQTFKMMG